MLCLRTEIMHEAHCHLGLFEKVAASSGLPVGVSMRSKIIKCINSFVQELRWTDDRPERHRLPCRGGGSQQPETVSARGVAGPDAGGDGALDADTRLPFEKGDASGLGVFSGTPGLHRGGLQCAGPVARPRALYVGLCASLDC